MFDRKRIIGNLRDRVIDGSFLMLLAAVALVAATITSG